MGAWEKNARIDPLYAILTDRSRLNSWQPEEFFETGENEIGRLFQFMESENITPSEEGTFLDFGCGVGRNTRALMKRFANGIGVDVSPTMIDLAQKYAAKDPSHAKYILNTNADLRMIPDRSVDFVYSHIVLQHLPTTMQASFVSELCRILSPVGLAAFQIPSQVIANTFTQKAKALIPPHLKPLLRTLIGKGTNVSMEMHTLPQATVSEICAKSGTRIVALAYTNSTEPDCNGELKFMRLEEALRRISNGDTQSPYLSPFYFVRRNTV